MKSGPFARVCTSLLVMLLATGNALAALIPFTDIALTGSVELSTTVGTSPFSDGNVTQNGAIRTTVGGATTSNGFSTTPGTADGTNDGTTTLPASNPLAGTLTDTGDGVGWSTDVDAGFPTGFNFGPGYNFITDFGVNLQNTSVGGIFTVTMQLDYSHAGDADGNDAFAEAKFDLLVDGVNQINREVKSDSLLGDELNATPTGTTGALISDSNTLFFDVVINPGATIVVNGLHQWEGGVYESGASLMDIGVDLSIAGVTCTGDCNVIPAPAAVWLFGSGLLGLVGFTRRRKTT